MINLFILFALKSLIKTEKDVFSKSNQKLAKNRAGQATIETRGQGGYVVAPPHPSYKVLHNDLNNIPTITKEQHEEMLSSAVSLDELVGRAVPRPPKN